LGRETGTRLALGVPPANVDKSPSHICVQPRVHPTVLVVVAAIAFASIQDLPGEVANYALVDGILDVVQANQAPVADRQADHVETELSPVRLHL